ncbi:Cell shape determining protein MreD [Rhodospirillaceae bacterium LM-1]|nr:Cell shape determining protein MreD [Rhodospirillaceae bacterium LM-1]
MRPAGLTQRLDIAARHLLPVLFTLFLLLVSLLPLKLPGLAGIMPPLALMGVFYWGVYRPDLLNGLSAFVIGIAQDLLFGLPIGVSALVMLLVHGFAQTRRRSFLSHGFLVVWVGFALAAAGASLLTWILVSVLAGTATNPNPAFTQFVLTVLTYPLFARLMGLAHQTLLKEE